MKRITTIGACALSSLALVGVTGASAGNGGENGDRGRSEVAKDCAAQKKADKPAFEAFYGKHAMRNCIKGEPEEPTVREFKSASKDCRDEREADLEGFRSNYGTNENGRNALGKCVSEQVKNSDEEEGEATS